MHSGHSRNGRSEVGMENKNAVNRVLREATLGKFLRRRASDQNVGGEGKVIINFEEAVFNLMNVHGKVHVGQLFKVMEEQGILRDDPRLRKLLATLSDMAAEEAANSEDGAPILIENLALNKDCLVKLVKESRIIISKSLRAAFIIPEFRKFCAKIRQFYIECTDHHHLHPDHPDHHFRHHVFQAHQHVDLSHHHHYRHDPLHVHGHGHGHGHSDNHHDPHDPPDPLHPREPAPLHRQNSKRSYDHVRRYEQLHSHHHHYQEIEPCGEVFQRIPQTANANPHAFGVSVCTIDGQRYSVGHAKEKFLLMSGSNVLTYAVARTELDCELVHKYVGQEPSGRNDLEFALDYMRRPHNPMIDSGGIMMAALIQKVARPDMKYSEVFDWVYSFFKRMTGGLPLSFNNAAYIAMKTEAADGNFAQAFYMKEHKSFPPNTDLAACMELYLQCKCMEVTCETLSLVAATLANGGVNPLTEEAVLPPDAVTDTLSLMHSCGLKEYSGHFAFEIGTPAKSAASGYIMVVVPNVLGYCVWSPPVDKFEISIKGLKFSKKIVDEFPFHPFDNLTQRRKVSAEDPRVSEVHRKSEAVVSLLFSAAAGDVTELRRKYLSGQEMTVTDYDGRTPLHLAAAEGHVDAVHYLVHTCNVPESPVDRWGRTPLDDAKLFEHTAIVKILEQAGATGLGGPEENLRENMVVKNAKPLNRPVFAFEYQDDERQHK